MIKADNAGRRRVVLIAAVAGLAWVGATARAADQPGETSQTAQRMIPAKGAKATSSSQVVSGNLPRNVNTARGESIQRPAPGPQKEAAGGGAREAERGKKEKDLFLAKLDAASSGAPEIAPKRLEELCRKTEDRLADLDTSLTQKRALLKETQDKVKAIGPNEESPNLSYEEKLRRAQRRFQKSTLEVQVQKIQREVEALEDEHWDAETQLRQVETALAKLLSVASKSVSETSGTIRPVRGAAALTTETTAAAVSEATEAPGEVRRPARRYPQAGEREKGVAAPESRGEKMVQPAVAAAVPPSGMETTFVTEESTEPIPALRPAVVGFLLDRGLDLCDLLRFRLNVPDGFRGVGVKARATCLAQVGFIYFDGKSVGADRRGVGVWRERRLEGGVGPVYFSRLFGEMVVGNRYLDVRRPWSRMYRRGIVRNGIVWDDGRGHPLSAGAEVQLFFLGLEFEVYPLEWLDAAFGWVGLDPFNDDENRILRQWVEWKTIPELKVRDEWRETYTPPTKEAPVMERTGKAGVKVEMPAEKKAPSGELPLGEPGKEKKASSGDLPFVGPEKPEKK